MILHAAILALALSAPVQTDGSQPVPATTGAPTATDIEPALEAELKSIDARVESVQDLTADFEQTRHSPLLRKPLVSKGEVRVKGARVRWDTKTPHPAVMSIDLRELRLYYPDQKVVEIYELTDALRRVTASPLPRLATVREQFTIVRSPDQPRDADKLLAIDLTPKDKDLRDRVAKVRVTIERATGLAAQMNMTDADGEETLIAFTSARVNSGLADRELELDVPAGTRESRPLQGLKGAPPSPGGRK